MKSFKNYALCFLLTTLLWSPALLADGFICEAPGENLKVQVYNRTHARQGTRNAAVMILSDSSKKYGERTLARFYADNDELSNRGATYVASVQSAKLATNQRRLNVAGLKLAQIQEIILRVDFAYNRPIKAGQRTTGTLEFYRINGDQLWLDVNCVRYLKRP
jgi:hypothetical protein